MEAQWSAACTGGDTKHSLPTYEIVASSSKTPFIMHPNCDAWRCAHSVSRVHENVLVGWIRSGSSKRLMRVSPTMRSTKLEV